MLCKNPIFLTTKEFPQIVFPVGISDGMIGISKSENPNGAQKFQKLYLSLPFTSVIC